MWSDLIRRVFRRFYGSELLPIGTWVRVTDQHNYFYGRVGMIEGDNAGDIWVAKKFGWYVPPLRHSVVFVIPGDDDIEHGGVGVGGYEIVTDAATISAARGDKR